MPPPKANFRIPLEDGSNLSLSIFPTRKDPEAEVIVVQISRKVEENWENLARIAVYRSREGNYSKLPDRDNQQ
jgi:hypothetical protein